MQQGEQPADGNMGSLARVGTSISMCLLHILLGTWGSDDCRESIASDTWVKRN